MKIAFVLLLSIISSFSSFSQKRKLEIVQTDEMVGDRNIRKLYGNVIFRHQDMYMYCDSAYYYAKENIFEAYSKVKIENNNVVIYADTLYYTGQSGLARLRGRIKMINGDITLTTSHLDYNSRENIGYYYNNGKIVDKANVLTSRFGHYYINSNMMFFKKNVELVNKDYRIVTDTLKYHTVSKTAFFLGSSRIISKENLLYTENGWYNTNTNIAQFNKKSYINTKAQFVFGDSLHYNRNTDVGRAFGNVLIKDTVENIFLHGDRGYYNGKKDLVYVTNNILFIKAFTTDSLYLHADSIFSQRFPLNVNKPDSASYHIVKAYYKTRFFKQDVQGVCDSLVYHSKDSMIYMHVKPVIWTNENQITGNSITLTMVQNQIEKVYIDSHAFLIAQDDEKTFNQMKGKSLTGYIKNNELYKVDISQNGETVYFLRDEGDMVGVNKAVCNDISVYIQKGKVQRIVFRSKPSGVLYPPDELSDDAKLLDGFRWLQHLRPLNHTDIFKWRE